MAAQDVAQRIERETGYKSVSWQEAHEDLLSAFVVRNIIMYTVVGAILLVASFGTYNIISTITHEKTRDIAILKSLGLREATVRRIFVLEALMIGLIGALAGWALGLCADAGARHHRDQEPDDRCDPPAAGLLVPALRHGRRGGARSPRWSPAISRRARRRGSSGRHHPGGDMSDTRAPCGWRRGCRAMQPLIAASGVTRILPGMVPTTLVHDIDLAIGTKRIRRHHRPVRLGQVVAALSARPARPADRRRGAHPRPRHRAHGRGRARADAAVDARLRVPVPFPAAGVLRAGERDAADAGAGRLSAEAMRERAVLTAGLARARRACRSGPISSPAASASAWRSRARSPTIRRSSWPTSRPARSNSRSSEQVFEILRDLVDQRGKTVVAVTHDLDLARRMDRRIVLQDGGIASDDGLAR